MSLFVFCETGPCRQWGCELLLVFCTVSFVCVSWGHPKANYLAKPNLLFAPGWSKQISVFARKQLERQRFAGKRCAEGWAGAGGSWGGEVVEGAGGDWLGSNSVRAAGASSWGTLERGQGGGWGGVRKCQEIGSRQVGQRAAGTGWRAVCGKRGRWLERCRGGWGVRERREGGSCVPAPLSLASLLRGQGVGSGTAVRVSWVQHPQGGGTSFGYTSGCFSSS